jgi:hypothetical protein
LQIISIPEALGIYRSSPEPLYRCVSAIRSAVKTLGYRTDFEDSVSVHWTGIVLGHCAVGNNSTAGRLDDADDDPHAWLLPLDALAQNPVDFGIRRNPGFRRSLASGGLCQKKDSSHRPENGTLDWR